MGPDAPIEGHDGSFGAALRNRPGGVAAGRQGTDRRASITWQGTRPHSLQADHLGSWPHPHPPGPISPSSSISYRRPTSKSASLDSGMICRKPCDCISSRFGKKSGDRNPPASRPPHRKAAPARRRAAPTCRGSARRATAESPRGAPAKSTPGVQAHLSKQIAKDRSEENSLHPYHPYLRRRRSKFPTRFGPANGPVAA
jgi:hypothetical protein